MPEDEASVPAGLRRAGSLSAPEDLSAPEGLGHAGRVNLAEGLRRPEVFGGDVPVFLDPSLTGLVPSLRPGRVDAPALVEASDLIAQAWPALHAELRRQLAGLVPVAHPEAPSGGLSGAHPRRPGVVFATCDDALALADNLALELALLELAQADGPVELRELAMALRRVELHRRIISTLDATRTANPTRARAFVRDAEAKLEAAHDPERLLGVTKYVGELRSGDRSDGDALHESDCRGEDHGSDLQADLQHDDRRDGHGSDSDLQADHQHDDRRDGHGTDLRRDRSDELAAELAAELYIRAERALAPTRPGRRRPVPTIEAARFRALDRLPDAPLCVRGLVDRWPAKTRWSLPSFASRYAEIEVRLRRGGYGGDQRRAPLAEFLAEIQRSERCDWYLIDWGFEHVDAALLDDYDVPELFHSWHWDLGLHERPGLRSIYIGTVGSGSRLHVDVLMTAAWNALIVGHKRWLFAAPDQGEAVYDGQVDALAPDLRRHPEFAEAELYEHVQRPGELLYTPSGWWHQVANLEPTLALTENFVNEGNWRTVLDCPWGREHEDLREVAAALHRSIRRRVGADAKVSP